MSASALIVSVSNTFDTLSSFLMRLKEYAWNLTDYKNWREDEGELIAVVFILFKFYLVYLQTWP